MQIIEAPHEHDFYAQHDAAMQQFRGEISPWLASAGEALYRELKPLAKMLVKEPKPEKIPEIYTGNFTLAHKFTEKQIARGPRFMGHVIGLCMREHAMELSERERYVAPVPFKNFAVSTRQGGNLLLAGGNNQLNAPHPADEAKLAWLIRSPRPGDNPSETRLMLVSRKLLRERTISHDDFGLS